MALPELVLVHGWGLNAGVWEHLLPALEERWRVRRLELPGHGCTPWREEAAEIYGLARILAEEVPERAVWVGWSLGGMAGLQVAAMAPDRVERLVLVAAAPRFVRGPGWDHGMDVDALHQFAAGLETDYRATLQRFLALEALGSEHAREELRTLRTRLTRYGEPQPAALRAGLSILERADLRVALSRVRCPVLQILGARDRLVPPQAGPASRRWLPGLQVVVLPGAAHAPFLSHPGAFLEAMEAG
jgi:pimeloyl-[acyl-carrier protein] methyl ester esterase